MLFPHLDRGDDIVVNLNLYVNNKTAESLSHRVDSALKKYVIIPTISLNSCIQTALEPPQERRFVAL